MNKVLRNDAVHRGRHAGQAATCHLIIKQCFMAKVASTTTKLFGYVDAQETELTGTAPNCMAYMSLLARGFVLRRDFIVEKAGNVIAEKIKFFIHPRRAEINRHGSLGER